jgi:hypothetical protein
VPEDQVEECFSLLASEDWGEFATVRDYFEDVYIGRWQQVRPKPVRGRAAPAPVMTRSKPLFPPKLWNQYDRTLAGEDRTNNRVEAFNAAFNTALGPSHPSMWTLLKQFQIEANSSLSKSEQVLAGTYKRRVHKTYQKLNTTLISLCQKYNDFDDKVEYLLRVSLHLSSI